MQEATLKKISLLTTLLGVSVLCLLASHYEPPLVKVSELGDEDEVEVRLQGRVVSVSETDKVAFVTLGQEKIETVDVVVFKDHEFSLSEGSYVQVRGTTEEYQGEVSVIAGEIEVGR